jgi:hypothetical protein
MCSGLCCQAIWYIVAFFGVLHLLECMDLVLEKIQRGKEGYIITHNRAKQRRSDKVEYAGPGKSVVY